MKYIKPQIKCVKVECNIVATSFATGGGTSSSFDDVVAGQRNGNLSSDHNLWDEKW